MGKQTRTVLRTAAGFVLLAAAFALAPASESRWTGDFTAWYDANQSRARGSTSSASLAWFESHLLQGCLAEYEATLDTAWLDRFVLHADTMFAVMRDVPDTGKTWPGYADGFRGWGTTRYDPAHRYQEYLVHDGFICLPVARFVRLVYSTPGLEARYLTKARRYQVAIEQDIVAKWFRNWGAARGNGDDLETFGGWRGVPQNMFLTFGELLLVFTDIRLSPAYVCTAPEVPASFYTAVPDSMAAVFRASLHVGSAVDAWTWSYWPVTVADTTPEDLSHGNLDISFALEASRHGIGFTAADMRRFASTFTRLIWNGSTALPRFSSLVNGRGRDSIFYLADWVRLAEHDTTISRLVAGAFETNPCDPVTMNAGQAQTTAWLARAEVRFRSGIEERPDPVANKVVAGTGGRLRVNPNPLVTRGVFSFTTMASGVAGLVVYDESGRAVRRLACGELAAGSHRVQWDRTDELGETVPAGVYRCVLATATGREAVVLVVIR